MSPCYQLQDTTSVFMAQGHLHVNPSNAEATFVQSARTQGHFHINPSNEAKIFEKYLNPVMLVYIGKLSLRTLIWVSHARVQSFFSFFASFRIDLISHQQQKE